MKTYLTLSAIALAAAATLSSGAVMAADPAPATQTEKAPTKKAEKKSQKDKKTEKKAKKKSKQKAKAAQQ
jgi:hypothetical protein